jgi:hypothetical protein
MLIFAVVAAVIALALSSASALALFSTQTDHAAEHPAHCHQRATDSLPPAPVNHQCCANGHLAAILGASFLGAQLTCQSMVSEISADLRLRTLRSTCSSALSLSIAVSGMAPLRI